ncbi:hypothetical protein [Desulfococcus sp.]|uniref:hypothetical protein n=1 Tax=Desulfococcus sp. TaxID=2025834 RepID=UPI0035942606
MTTEKTHIPAKDIHGNDYYCPVPGGPELSEPAAPDLADCVEKDVTERYSGNIDIAK